MGKRIKYTGRYAGQRLPRRITAMLAAVIIMGIGVSLYVLGGMGADPFSTLNLGVSSKLGLTFGTWQIIFNGILPYFLLTGPCWGWAPWATCSSSASQQTSATPCWRT